MITYKPKVDKVSVTVPVPEPELQDATLQAIANMKAPGEWGGYVSISGGSYKQAVIIVLPMDLGFKQGTTMCLHAGNKDDKKNFLRLEWNPSALGLKGLDYLQQEFGDFLPDWRQRILETGRVTRVDIACDFTKIKVDDIIVWSKKVQKYGLFTNANGETETLYLGDKKSNQVVVYDRIAKLKEENQEAFKKHNTTAVLKPIPKYPITRIERRLRKNSIDMADLLSLSNPFSGVEVFQPKPIQFLVPQYRYPAFRNMAQMRGYKRAVAALPPAYRTKYEKTLLASKAGWWNADNVWKHWPRALKNAGLLAP